MVQTQHRGRDMTRGAEDMKGARSKSRAMQRVRSKSRAARFEVRDAPATIEENNINKFVQYKHFGLLATENCRVIAIDEIPEITQRWMVVIKVKVSKFAS